MISASPLFAAAAVDLKWIDYTILIAYTAFVVGIGFALKRYMKTSADFLTSGRSIPAWVTGLAFMSANLGALELVGMAASGAKYGISTAHFYWVGAIPAMIFLAVFMMPFYYGSKARSVPEYLKMRFDERVRALNSLTFAVMTVFASGISMNALAKLLNQLLGWDYHAALWICSGIVLIYVLKGGLTSAIYTEVLQFFMIVLGFAPVVYLGLKDVGGYGALKDTLQKVAVDPMALGLNDKTFQPDAWTSAWTPLLGGPSANPMGVDIFAMVFGLGFVLSFGYWCTNFLVVQRAMAARNMTAARQTPLIAAVPKMLMPVLVILPGMLAIGLATLNKGYELPKVEVTQSDVSAAVKEFQTATAAKLAPEKVASTVAGKLGAFGFKPEFAAVIAQAEAAPMSDAEVTAAIQQNFVPKNDYDGVILSLVQKYCPPGLLGLALTALLASFMSGMAGNVTAFNTVWTYDLYQAYVAKNKSDAHYAWMGRFATIAGILLSIACAYFAKNFNTAMDVVQLVFGFVNAPLFATFLLGMFWVRTTGTGAFLGLLGGTATSAIFHGFSLASGNAVGVKGGYFAQMFHVTPASFPSEMAQNFWLATFAFGVCLILTIVISLATKQNKTVEDLRGLVYSLTPRIQEENVAWYARPGVLGLILLACCIILNIIFW
jgi:SSS family solute:Na+ symporter